MLFIIHSLKWEEKMTKQHITQKNACVTLTQFQHITEGLSTGQFRALDYFFTPLLTKYHNTSNSFTI